jgi:hypothetical protein
MMVLLISAIAWGNLLAIAKTPTLFCSISWQASWSFIGRYPAQSLVAEIL